MNTATRCVRCGLDKIRYDEEGVCEECRWELQEGVNPNGQNPTTDAPFDLVALDWDRLKREGLPRVEYLDEPYIPARARVWASGPTEAAKSMWVMHKCAQLSREGRRVVFVSMENPLAEDARRLDMLRPDWRFFTFCHHEEQPEVFDLVKPAHVDALVRIATDQALVAQAGSERQLPLSHIKSSASFTKRTTVEARYVFVRRIAHRGVVAINV